MSDDHQDITFPVTIPKGLFREAQVMADAAGLERDQLIVNALDTHLDQRMKLPEFPAIVARDEEHRARAYKRLMARVPSG